MDSKSQQDLRRPGVTGVHSVDHFAFSVPSLDEAERFYSTFGLDVRRNGNALELRTFGNPHRWGVVHASGAPKKTEYLCLGIFADDTKAFEARIAKAGIGCAPHPLSDGEGLWLKNPDGLPVQLKVAPKVSPSIKSEPAPSGPARGVAAAPARSQVTQVKPRRLSHVLFFTPDVTRMVEFSRDVLGMALSDHSQDIIAFMHGVHGSDHHLVAFAKSDKPGLHHSSWDVGSIDDVGLGAEQMRVAGYDQGWGIGRHVLGSNYFYYVRDPWKSWAEYSFGIDFIVPDGQWKANNFPPEDSFYVWGPSVHPEFINNFESAS
jgi:catechol 2,3-dioxygenase-like lactoylglutathione lyase family enzyme